VASDKLSPDAGPPPGDNARVVNVKHGLHSMSFETRQLQTFRFSSRAVRLPTTWLGSGQFLWKRPLDATARDVSWSLEHLVSDLIEFPVLLPLLRRTQLSLDPSHIGWKLYWIDAVAIGAPQSAQAVFIDRRRRWDQRCATIHAPLHGISLRHRAFFTHFDCRSIPVFVINLAVLDGRPGPINVRLQRIMNSRVVTSAVMSNDQDVLTESDEVFLRVLRRQYAVSAAWPCRTNRLSEPARQSEPARAQLEARGHFPSRRQELPRV
jgi:hypothetical protein